MEMIENKLVFALSTEVRSSPGKFPTKIVDLDDHYVLRTANRFMPPSIKSILRHCAEVQRRLREFDSIVYITNDRSDGYSLKKRTHSCLFMGAYAVIYLDWSINDTMDMLNTFIGETLDHFHDHNGSAKYGLGIEDCLEAIKIGVQKFGWFTYDGVDPVKNGLNMNWVIPNKIIAMKDPKTNNADGKVFVDRRYMNELLKHKIDYVVRLNSRDYEDDPKYGLPYPVEEFFNDGIGLRDIAFKDGGIPTRIQVDSFIDICSIPESQLAVHCHAGLGRTGTMICCYLIQDYGFTSRQAVAWLNLCRRGSVMGQQHGFLDKFYEDVRKENMDNKELLPVKDPEFSGSINSEEAELKSDEEEPKSKKWKVDELWAKKIKQQDNL